MSESGNIVIGDDSALHFYLHCASPSRLGLRPASRNPLAACAENADSLSDFNADHPLYGGAPVTLLVNSPKLRRFSGAIECRTCAYDLPPSAFYELREGLYVVSPQLAFVRMALRYPLARLVEMGLNLCARFYIQPGTGAILERSEFLTTPAELDAFVLSASSMYGSRNTRRALKWAVSNSGSPLESKMWTQFRLPRHLGGFNLPFDAMNYDVAAGRNARMTAQAHYSIDMVNIARRFGLEYDGAGYHQDASADKRRRNELAALGWDVFPIDRQVLYDPEATERVACQIARKMGIRLRTPRSWDERYAQLRKALGLPF